MSRDGIVELQAFDMSLFRILHALHNFFILSFLMISIRNAKFDAEKNTVLRNQMTEELSFDK